MQIISYHFIILSLICYIECNMVPFVVGGKTASIIQFPHSAFLNVLCFVKEDRIPWICGASIVNDRIILTAAHCLAGCGSRSAMTISVGHADRKAGAVCSISSYVIHEHYTPFTSAYDIALIRLNTILPFGDKVKRVALMPDPPYSEMAQIAGWGIMNEQTNKRGNFLQFVDQNVWKSKACRQLITSLPKGTICASSRKSETFVSRGDSGSALVVRGYIQIGIVSYKMPKISRSLVVYTDTGYFFDWIRKNSKKLHCI